MENFDRVLGYATSAADAVRAAGRYPATMQQLDAGGHIQRDMRPETFHTEEALLAFSRRLDSIAPAARWGLNFAAA